jgi:hypothetical protein
MSIQQRYEGKAAGDQLKSEREEREGPMGELLMETNELNGLN